MESNYAKNNLKNDKIRIFNQVPPPSLFIKGDYYLNGDFQADYKNVKINKKTTKIYWKCTNQIIEFKMTNINRKSWM